jgi:hypothetical protein
MHVTHPHRKLASSGVSMVSNFKLLAKEKLSDTQRNELFQNCLIMDVNLIGYLRKEMIYYEEHLLCSSLAKHLF